MSENPNIPLERQLINTWISSRRSNNEPLLCALIISKTLTNGCDFPVTSMVSAGSIPPEASLLRRPLLFLFRVKLAELCTSLLSRAAESLRNSVTDWLFATVSELPSSECSATGSDSGPFEPVWSGSSPNLTSSPPDFPFEPVVLDSLTERPSRSDSPPVLSGSSPSWFSDLSRSSSRSGFPWLIPFPLTFSSRSSSNLFTFVSKELPQPQTQTQTNLRSKTQKNLKSHRRD
jgi:hypothetical protein